MSDHACDHVGIAAPVAVPLANPPAAIHLPSPPAYTPPRNPKPWDEIFMEQARTIAERSKDPSTQHGAIIVDRRHRVVSEGFNGPPRTAPDAQVDWSRPAKYAWVIHAEENAVLFGLSARGIDGLDGCVLYVTGQPCPGCMKLLAHVGIGEVRYGARGSACVDAEKWELSRRIARTCGVMLTQVEG